MPLAAALSKHRSPKVEKRGGAGLGENEHPLPSTHRRRPFWGTLRLNLLRSDGASGWVGPGGGRFFRASRTEEGGDGRVRRTTLILGGKSGGPSPFFSDATQAFCSERIKVGLVYRGCPLCSKEDRMSLEDLRDASPTSMVDQAARRASLAPASADAVREDNAVLAAAGARPVVAAGRAGSGTVSAALNVGGQLDCGHMRREIEDASQQWLLRTEWAIIPIALNTHVPKPCLVIFCCRTSISAGKHHARQGWPIFAARDGLLLHYMRS